MRRSIFPLILFPALMAGFSAVAQDLPELQVEKYVLDNGLEVLLHEDHSIPVVAVNVWYHVGSKNEKPGKTGFAHLFEHMMFQGTEHHDTDYFAPLQRIGARVNGSTSEDRTNYWENVPSDQLELALWLEADRMGYLLSAMTQEKLDNQKDVVKNEKREWMNQPYAKAEEILLSLAYPDEHPYSHSVIGSLEDLSSASLEDVSEFFRLYYAPNNASLCIAGDFDPAEAKSLVAQYFATIPPGRPVDRVQGWIPQIDGIRRAVAEDDVELSRIYYKWLAPAQYKPGDAEFDLLAEILAGSKTSRLYKSLVYDLQIAQDVSAYLESQELNGEFYVEVTARAGVDLDELERLTDQELRKIIDKGVTEKELSLAKTSYESAFVRGLQRIGQFGGKADRLNRYNVMVGDPNYLQRDLDRYRNATAKGVLEYARRYLDLDRRVILRIVPQGSLLASDQSVDRDQMPESSGPVQFQTPDIQTATLSNGLDLYLVEKHSLPLIDVRIAVLSGWAADPLEKPGTASLTAELLDEGTRSRDAMEISSAAQALGANLRTGSFFDGSFVNLNVLKREFDRGLELMSDILLNPSFPKEELERQRNLYIGRVQQEATQPQSIATRVLQQRIFGTDHPYAQPMSGSGTVQSLNALTRDDLVRFHQENYLPNNAAVVIVGDITMDEARSKFERAFANWNPGTVPAHKVIPPAPRSDAKVLIVDRPGAPQSFVMVGQLGMTRNDPDDLSFRVMNTALGGQFTARINMNLREDKGYTYGAWSYPISMRDTGLFVCTAPVHTQYTKETLVEIISEMNGIKGGKPLTDTEILDAKNRLILSYPQSFETFSSVSGELLNLILYDLPLDEWQTYLKRVQEFDRSAAERVLEKHLHPEGMVYVVVGDRAVVEEGIRELNLGEIEIVPNESLQTGDQTDGSGQHGVVRTTEE